MSYTNSEVFLQNRLETFRKLKNINIYNLTVREISINKHFCFILGYQISRIRDVVTKFLSYLLILTITYTYLYFIVHGSNFNDMTDTQ